jgi:hypothetical protein
MNVIDVEQDQGVRLSGTYSCPTCPSRFPLTRLPLAVVYLKNRITKGWAPAEEHSSAKPIPEEEKPNFRNRIVPFLANSPPQIRAQIIPTLQKVLTFDFPTKWPEFLDITISLLQANDANSVFAGVQCILAMCRVYRFKGTDNRQDFDKVVSVTFPLLLNIGNGLVNENSIEAGEMLRTLLKAYKHAIYVSIQTLIWS